ncbi:MAG: class I SAM-dependent methyltransferase [Gammaproteobacteria bacterium]|nr:class I SAM-dependent methyltransferase [Gammaproteobacteria bacterium]
MLNENQVAQHYSHGNLIGAIEAAVSSMGKTTDKLSIDDLGPVDEFHIGGRVATSNLLGQTNFGASDHIIDMGCGLGGASRFIANKINSRVTGVDLTQEYVDTGNELNRWVGLDKLVNLQQGSILSLPFEDESFDGALMLHVGMNIADKNALFKEAYRVLKPGAIFGIYDVMKTGDGDLTYPVPWATDQSTSSLASAEEYQQALEQAGFKAGVINNRRDFGLEFFKQMKAKTEANGGPPPLGLHTLMQASTPLKLKNMIENISAGNIAPIEIIAQR